MVNIPENMRKAFKSEKSGNIIVIGRLMYAAFYKSVPPSRGETDPKKFQYGSTVLIPEFIDISVLDAAIKETAETNIPAAQRATTKWKHPILETSDTGKTAVYADDYPRLIRPNSKQFERKTGKERLKPGVVDSSGNPIDESRDAEETYNGRWARVSLQPYWYPPQEGKPGVALGLVNVQLLWHDDPLAGGKTKTSSDFEPVEGLEDMAEDFA